MKTTLLALLLSLPSLGQTPAPVSSATSTMSANAEATRLRPGAKLFVEPMEGFEIYLSAAILKKKVPVVIVDDRSKADYVVTGTSHVERAGWAKTIFISGAPQAAASITVKDAHNGDLAFAYSVDKFNAARASQSTAEACAKHMKQAIEKK